MKDGKMERKERKIKGKESKNSLNKKTIRALHEDQPELLDHKTLYL